jgi:hypothetical protein
MTEWKTFFKVSDSVSGVETRHATLCEAKKAARLQLLTHATDHVEDVIVFRYRYNGNPKDAYREAVGRYQYVNGKAVYSF